MNADKSLSNTRGWLFLAKTVEKKLRSANKQRNTAGALGGDLAGGQERWLLRCPALPRGAGQGGDFAWGPAKFGALCASVRTLLSIDLLSLSFP